MKALLPGILLALALILLSAEGSTLTATVLIKVLAMILLLTANHLFKRCQTEDL